MSLLDAAGWDAMCPDPEKEKKKTKHELQMELYEKTTKRLARARVKDPTAQIIYLAEEIERYRAKIQNLEALLYGLPGNDEKQDPLLTAALKQVAELYEKAKGMDYVRNNLAWALHQVWKSVDILEIVKE